MRLPDHRATARADRMRSITFEIYVFARRLIKHIAAMIATLGSGLAPLHELLKIAAVPIHSQSVIFTTLWPI